MKPDADTVARKAVNDLASDNDVLFAHRDAQRQCRPFGNVVSRAQVKPAEAYVFSAGDTSYVGSIEVDVNYQSRAIKLPALVPREFVTSIFINH